MTLRTRLAVWFASLLALLIVLLGAAIFALMWWSMLNDIDMRLHETAEVINSDSRFAILPATHSTRFQVDLPELDFVRASGIEVQVWIKNGDQYLPVDSSANLQNYPDPLDQKVLGRADTYELSTADIGGMWWRVHTSPIWYGDEKIGSIQVAQSLEALNLATRSLVLVVLACSLIAITGGVVISRWLARRLLEPIEDLTSAASRIVSAPDLSTRLTWNGPSDELGRLIDVFNRMMERLQNVFTVQERFVADISHELRTPLTGILGHIDLMRRYGVDEEALDAIHSDGSRMSRLVNDLLMLARSDYGGGSRFNMITLDADSILTSAVQSARHAAEKKGVALSIAHIEPLQIMGDPQQIKQLLDNLIDNAIKFTPEGGQVTLNMQRVDRTARIEVTDTGIGIAPEHQAAIFNRFYQADTSRMQDGTGGFGLGLSIARWIAEAHHGSVEVRSLLGQGSTFSVHLPLVNAFEDNTLPTSPVTRQRMPRLRPPDSQSAQ